MRDNNMGLLVRHFVGPLWSTNFVIVILRIVFVCVLRLDNNEQIITNGLIRITIDRHPLLQHFAGFIKMLTYV